MSEYATDFAAARKRHGAGQATCQERVAEFFDAANDDASSRAFICLRGREELQGRAAELDRRFRESGRDPATLPLYGLTFAVKDNIDLAGLPTTAACPDFAYTPGQSAPVVERLESLGALAVGKTNMDQFATGLTGCRSPHGTPVNAVDPSLMPGGSSSGSAVSVARGLADFSLGTDTAGSGRIPAAANAIVGLKPSRGLISCRGVVPACRSLDCVSIFARSVPDAMEILTASAFADPFDPFSRAAPKPWDASGDPFPARFAVWPGEHLPFDKDQGFAQAYAGAVDALERMGATPVATAPGPFLEAGAMLYQGPFLAERYASLGEFIEKSPGSVLPLTLSILRGGKDIPAAAVFAAWHRLRALRREAAALFEDFGLLMLPALPSLYTLDEVAADPLGTNSRLGLFSTFVNLLDLCALSVPAGLTGQGVPFGVTLIAPAMREPYLAAAGARLHAALGLAAGPGRLPLSQSTGQARVKIAVAGAHLSDQPLNWQLVELGGRLLRRVKSAPAYRLFALENHPPLRPGMVRVGENGTGVELEVWDLPPAGAGNFLSRVLAPLAIGNVLLEDGEVVKGFICEEYATAGERDISAFGGWRAWLASR